MKTLFTIKSIAAARLNKLVLLMLFINTGFIANAQSKTELSKIKGSVDASTMAALKTKFTQTYEQDEKKVADYLAKHAGISRSFVRNTSFYWMKTVDAAGNPVYINTKNLASGQLIKADQLYSGGSLGINITGTGMIAGIWDGGQVRATHELLTGHVAMEPGQTLDGSGSNYSGNNHQTHVSGTMVGKDIANQPSARGIAFNATAKNYDFSNDLAEMTTFAGGGYLISNHSYGGSNDNTTPLWKFGAYNDEAKDWDALLKTAPSYLPFVAIGNEQQSSGNPTKAGYDIVTGSAAAKNVMTVGAVNGDMTMSDYSNWGPTDDGRVKPDIVAKGTGINSSYYADPVTHLPSDNSYSGNGVGSSGTSYASPAAAASGLLLQQYYNSLYSTYMKASTLKGLMLGTATDLGQPGPDPKFGWGLLNIEKAARLIKYKTAAANPGGISNTNTSALSYAYIEEMTFNPPANSIDECSRDVVASGCEPLVVSVSWTDDEGTEQIAANGVDPTGTRLAYDFDFMVRNTATFVDVRPWKPVSMANRTANAGLCTGWFDVNYNNFKQVIIQNPTPGQTYRIYFRKKSGSPAAARIISLIVSGLRVLPPTGTANQSFCGNKQLSDVVTSASATTIKWYDASTAGNLLPATTTIVSGTTYYAAQIIEGCESTTRLAVTVTITSSTAAPTGNTTQNFCTASTVANLVASGSNIKWYDAATAGNLLPSTTSLVNNATYYASQTVSGCESITRLAVTVTLGSTTAAPTGNVSQSFCNSATVANLSASGTNIKWYDAASNGNLLASTAALVNGTTYYASQTVGSCESATRLAVTVTLTTTAAPTGTASQSFCNTATVANLAASGTAIQWYDAANAGNLLALTTALTNGTTYYASQTVSGCESATRFAVTVTLTTTAAPTGNASQSFCNSATIVNLAATGAAIKWYDAANAGNLLASTTALTNGTIYYASQTVGGCESAIRFAVTVTLTTTAAPTGSASQSFCNASTVANLVANGSNIKWYDAASNGNLLASTTALVNGTTYYASQTISGCESTTRLAVTVTITAAPNAIINYIGSPYCSNAGTATVSLSGTTGGTYSAAPAGLTINATTGAVTLATSTAGTYTVTYTIAASGGCNTTITTTNVTVTAAPNASISYTLSPYCSNAGTVNVTRIGTAGGAYSSTAGLTINATTGAITTTTSTIGTYVVTYTVAAAGGCAAFSTTTNVTINALPTASIAYAASPYCSNAGVASVIRTGAAGGIYSSAAGLSINSTTGDVNLAASTAGTYTVTYTIAAGAGCAAVTANASITITALPSATISYAASPYCATAGIATVIRTGTAGGSYSSAAGLVINATTGDVNLVTSTAGTYTVSYTLAGAGGCNAVVATTSITINSLSIPPTAATVSNTNICGPSTVTLSVTGGSLGSGASWKWYSGTCGGTLVGTGASISVTVNATTTYFVRAEGTCNTTNCASVTATVNTQPNITIVASPYTSLVPAQSTTLTVTVTPTLAGNSFVWYRNGNVVNGANTNSLSGVTVDQLGTYTASVTTANGCTATSTSLIIKDSASDKLYVYPNPTNGRFNVRYYMNTQLLGFRNVIIYNSFGEKVYSKRIGITTAYTNIDIDIRNAGKGFFLMVVSDAYGNRLATSKIEVL